MSQPETTDTPEFDRLVKRLRGIRNFHVDWDPSASELTPEQRAAEINRMLDEVDAGNFEPLDFKDSYR